MLCTLCSRQLEARRWKRGAAVTAYTTRTSERVVSAAYARLKAPRFDPRRQLEAHRF
jgi:hypothetical protein